MFSEYPGNECRVLQEYDSTAHTQKKRREISGGAGRASSRPLGDAIEADLKDESVR